MTTQQAAAAALGGTRWRRFTLAFGVSFGAIATVLVLMANGVIAAPVTISGTVFTVKATSLVSHSPGSGAAFIQYGSVDSNGSAPTGVAVTYLPGGGVLSGLDQVVCGPTGLPGPFANLVVELKADSADATGGLIVDATSLNAATATFNNIQIGVPAPNGIPDTASVGKFAQTADGVTITGLNQQAVYTKAGTFALTNLGLSAHLAGSCPS
ncbi:MAG: hypothetical protein EPN43_05450 [Jatrophihabitans sp.]|nr:MAG: hypothetical protein EPN43_05450 [Jatrophihabitans sp.]